MNYKINEVCDKFYDDHITEKLKRLKQWVVWRFEERPNEPKPAKVPYNPTASHVKKECLNHVKKTNGVIDAEYTGAAKSNSSETWSDYDDACKAMKEGIFQGLGIQLYNNLCGIDIDGCIDIEGEISELAKDIIAIMDSYTEISPSGTGVHILFYGEILMDKSLYKKNPLNGVEVYNGGRYFTFTGRAINNKKPEQRTDNIREVLLKYMKKSNKQAVTNTINNQKTEILISDKEMIDIAFKAKNGLKFQQLWSGDITEYNSQSEADIALCNLLSFYVQADKKRIDSLFRQSGLYREKWEREDYRNNTINTAVLATSDTYKPSFNKIETVIPDEKAKSVTKPFLVPKSRGKPEDGLKVDVSLLAIHMKNKYDIKNYKNQFRIKQNNYYAHVEDIKKVISYEIPEHCRIPNNIKDCEELLLMDKELTLKDKDLANEEYISFENGVLNVKNKEFRSHKDEITKKLKFINQVGYNWNPNVETDKVADDFFNTVTGGNQEDINYLYQILGVSISGYRSFKNIFYFTGVKDSGKSVYMHVAEKLLTNTDDTKDYSNIGLRTLTDETSKEFTRIIGKRANICAETPHLKISSDTLLKQLSGGDSVVAQVKFKESVEFVNKAMLMFSGNTVPNFFVDDKSSISERLLIYRFKNAIPKNKQIKNLANKMNMEYIIQKAIEQLKLFIENNQEFTVPEEIFENQEEMLKDSDSIYKFYKDYVIVTGISKDRISNVDLYEEYINFMVSEGHLRKGWGGKLDLSKFKPSQYVFTVEIKKHHGKDNFKKQLSYNGGKADVFIYMALKNNSREIDEEGSEGFTPLSYNENKIIQGLFP